MNRGPYEIHITVDPPSSLARATFETLAEQLGWTTSEIARDPVLGKPVRFYFTVHAATETDAHFRLGMMSGRLIALGVPILRQKIELVIFDTAGCHRG